MYPWVLGTLGFPSISQGRGARGGHTDLPHLGEVIVTVTLSGDGAYVSGEDGQPCSVPADKVQALDTTGAGDTFAGAVLSGLIAGDSLSNATVRAHELARTVVSRFGARLSSGEM